MERDRSLPVQRGARPGVEEGAGELREEQLNVCFRLRKMAGCQTAGERLLGDRISRVCFFQLLVAGLGRGSLTSQKMTLRTFGEGRGCGGSLAG